MHRLITLLCYFTFTSYASNDWLYEVKDTTSATPMVSKEPIYVSDVAHYDSESATTENQSIWSHIQMIGSFEINTTYAIDINDFVQVKVITKDSLQFCLFQSKEPVDLIV